MKIRKIFLCILIIIAVGMIVGGGTLFAVGMNNLDWDFRRLDPYTGETIETIIREDEPLENIIINSHNRSVRIVSAGDGQLTVDCFVSERITTYYERTGSTVTITTRNERGRNSIFTGGGFWFRGAGSSTTVVRVPDGLNVTVTSTSGSLRVDDIATQVLTVTGASGSMRVNNVDVDGRLYVRNTSGSVRLSGVKAGEIEVRNSSGTVNLDTITAENSVTASVTSGSLRIISLTAGSDIATTNTSGTTRIDNATAGGDITVQNASGSIRADGLSAGGRLTVTSSSGTVRLQRIDVHSVNFESGSGSVRIAIVGQRNDFDVYIRHRRGSDISHADTGRHIRGSSRNGTVRLEFI